jgi:hypothetical protein
VAVKAISFPHRRSTAVDATATWWHLVILHDEHERKIVGGALVRGSCNPWSAHFRAACMCRAFGNDAQAVSVMLSDSDVSADVMILGGPNVFSADRVFTAEEAKKIAEQWDIYP